MVKKLPAMRENWGSIPGSGRSPGEGIGNFPAFVPVKFHGWRNLAGYEPVHGDTESQTRLTNEHFHFSSYAASGMNLWTRLCSWDVRKSI